MNIVKYEKHVTIFFDILGFAQLVNKTNDARGIYNILNKLVSVSGDLKKNMKKATFSDLVVLATTQTTSTIGDEAYIVLNNIFNEIARIQAQLVANSILIRGGITYDKLYIDNNFIFGKGLNEAYRLETNTANFPRIVIDPIVFDVYNSAFENHSHIITMDSDGVYYVDYFKYITANYNEYLSSINFLKTHKDFIVKQMEDLGRGLTSVNLKFTWLIIKHNECISKLPDQFSEYKISTEVIDQLTKRQGFFG